MTVSLAIDPATGDLVLDADGQPVYTGNPTPELYLAIGVPLGSYYGDPEQGSRIPALLSGPPPRDAEAEIEAAATEAVRRLEDAGLVEIDAVEYVTSERRLLVATTALTEPFEVTLS